jgi:hypothetical protein
MATWTTLPDASLEPGKPIRSIDGLALRDNPVAITEGETGAPRIIGRAAKRLADYPVLTVTAASTHSALTGITVVTGTTSTTSTSNVVAFTETINLYTGALRFGFTQRASAGPNSIDSIAQVYKNNVLVQTFTLGAGVEESTTAVRSLDISIAPNDVIEIRHRQTPNGTSGISAVTVNGSNGYTTRLLYINQLNVNTA